LTTKQGQGRNPEERPYKDRQKIKKRSYRLSEEKGKEGEN